MGRFRNTGIVVSVLAPAAPVSRSLVKRDRGSTAILSPVQVGFIEAFEDLPAGGLGEMAVIAETRVVGLYRRKYIDADSAESGHRRACAQYLACARNRDGHDRHPPARGGNEGAGPESADARMFEKRSLREEHQRLSVLRGPDDPARIPGTPGGRKALDKARPRSPEQKMDDGDVAHLALDDERKSRRQKALEQRPVHIARVIGDDDAVSGRQIVDAVDIDPDAGQPKRRTGGGGRETKAERQSGHDCDDDQRRQHADEENYPETGAPENFEQTCDVLHFMLTP